MSRRSARGSWTALFGTAAAFVAAIAASVASWEASYGPYLAAGGAIYLLGAIGVTIACNVPRNNALAKLDPAHAEAERRWVRFLAEWGAWNHVRTVASFIATGLAIGALYAG